MVEDVLRNSRKSENFSNVIFYFICISLTYVSLLPRVQGGYHVGKYLWAEDGTVFINEARLFQLSSIWKSYAGYLHAYPRLVAYLGNFYELQEQVSILFYGWMLAFGMMSIVLVKQAKFLKLSPDAILIFLSLVVLQPNYGEVFFFITNSQWMLGLALTVYVLTSLNKSNLSISEICFLMLLSLTGPFSILLVPILMWDYLYKKKSSINFQLYIVIMAGALIQFFVLISSNRMGVNLVDKNIAHWSRTIFSILQFGANTTLTSFLSFLFWTIFILAISSSKKSTLDEDRENLRMVWICLILSLIHLMAALYSSKDNPLVIMAPGGGNRYTWIPYSLIFFGAIISTKNFIILRYAIVGVMAPIFWIQMHQLTLTDFQFSSYEKFSHYRELKIPINPGEPKYPRWYIDTAVNGLMPTSTINDTPINLSEITSKGASMELKEGKLVIESNNIDPILELNHPIVCDDATDVGVEIKLSRELDGWLQLFWDQNKNFDEKKSIKRFYPAGQIKAQFAFPYKGDGIYLRFDPMEYEGAAEIQNIEIYCL